MECIWETGTTEGGQAFLLACLTALIIVIASMGGREPRDPPPGPKPGEPETRKDGPAC